MGWPLFLREENEKYVPIFMRNSNAALSLGGPIERFEGSI
jgi:hypothetical protein